MPPVTAARQERNEEASPAAKPPRVRRRAVRSALEEHVVRRQAGRLLLARRRGRARLDDQLVAGLEDDRLLVRDVDALAGQRVLVRATLADAALERAEALDRDLAAAAQQIADGVQHRVENTR